MPRIIVIGTSCSGKSTLASRLSKALDVPYVQLDALNWLPGWVERDNESFLSLVDQHTPSDSSWVVDGNYSRARHIFWSRAQYVIWLNYPFPLVFWRAIKRTTRRVFTKEELFSGNRETFKNAFLSTDSMILWVIKTHHSRKIRYRKQVDSGEYPHIHFIELNRPHDAEALLNQLDVFNVAS